MKFEFRYIFAALVLSTCFLLPSSEISAQDAGAFVEVNYISHVNVSEPRHTSGPCSLWWPLNGTQLHSYHEIGPEIFQLEAHLYCVNTTDSPSIYSGTFNINGNEIILPAFTPIRNKHHVYSFTILKKLIRAESTIDLTLFQIDEKIESKFSIVSNFSILIKIGSTYDCENKICTVPLRPLVPSISSMLILNSREDFGILLNALNLIGVAVEVGVQRATFSERFLSRWEGHRYVMVDPYQHYPEIDYVDDSNVAQTLQESIYIDSRKRMSKFGDRAIFLRLESLEAAKLLLDKSLDFVYIDARHDYFNFMSDLIAWWPKLKNGGILAGHDFQHAPIMNAVLEFSNKENVYFQVIATPSESQSWYIFKV